MVGADSVEDTGSVASRALGNKQTSQGPCLVCDFLSLHGPRGGSIWIRNLRSRPKALVLHMLCASSVLPASQRLSWPNMLSFFQPTHGQTASQLLPRGKSQEYGSSMDKGK